VYAQADRVVRLHAAAANRPRRVIGAPPYLHLLACVTRQASADPSWGIQFQVLRTSRVTGRPQSVALYQSAIHSM
jgi:hypothetical protein